MPRPKGIPKYTLHKSSGQARIRINGRDIYLGPYGSDESRRRYAEAIGKLETARREGRLEPLPTSRTCTVSVVLASYLQHAETWYRKHGQVTQEVKKLQHALRPVAKRFGSLLADDFGRAQLQTVRTDMIERGWTRRHINQMVSCIRRCFAWAAEQDLVRPTTIASLRTLRLLVKGRSLAAEGPGLQPVPWEHVEPILPYLLSPLRVAVQVQWWTGMRTFEVLQLRPCDLDKSGQAWIFRPRRSKLEHLDIKRQVAIGPQARALLEPLLAVTPAEGYLFNPQAALAEKHAAARSRRKTKVQPSQRNRRKKNPRRRPGLTYSTDTYARAITRAIQRFNRDHPDELIPHWRPYQLRHAAATRIRKTAGLDAARAVLGHRSLAMTDHYAELDLEAAREAMNKSG